MQIMKKDSFLAAGKIAAKMVEERINKRAGVRAGGRVDDHTGGFVHNKEVVVLVDDVEGDRLGEGFHLDGVRNGDLEDIALGHFRLGIR